MNILRRVIILLIPALIFSTETVQFEMVEQKKHYSHTDTTVIEAWLTIENDSSPSLVTLPILGESDQYNVISSEATQNNFNSIRIVNGVRTNDSRVKHIFRYTLELIPAGTLTIPELEVEYKNDIYRSNPLQVKHSSENRVNSSSIASNNNQQATERDQHEENREDSRSIASNSGTNDQQATERDQYENSSPAINDSVDNTTSLITTLSMILLIIIGGGVGLIVLGFGVGLAVRKKITAADGQDNYQERNIDTVDTPEDTEPVEDITSEE